MSHTITRRSQRYRAVMQRQLLEAQAMTGQQRVLALRCVARHCQHLGVREIAEEARQMARAGGAA
jgi:hypothetical protein